MVSIVLENVDEDLDLTLTWPAPPLTKTQHRLMTLLAVLRDREARFYVIASNILRIVRSKLFPETFFWPDDSVEMSARFYTALCKMLNNATAVWKLCVLATCEMRQRACIVVYTVLQTWPDVLHDASKVEDNPLPVTVVHLIMHTPKSEGERRLRQERKLLALKHLLIHFYHFDSVDTMENHVAKLLKLLLKRTACAEEALVLVARCKGWTWTGKHLVPKLMDLVSSWNENKIDDVIGERILNVVRQVAAVFPSQEDAARAQVGKVVGYLTEMLHSGKCKCY